MIIALQFFLSGGELKDVCLRPYTVQRTSRTVYDEHEALASMLVMMIMIIVLLWWGGVGEEAQLGRL